MAKESIGAFWLKESKKGVKYMSGKIGDKQIVMFKNNYKEKDNQPDYLIYESEPNKTQSDNQTRENNPFTSE